MKIKVNVCLRKIVSSKAVQFLYLRGEDMNQTRLKGLQLSINSLNP